MIPVCRKVIEYGGAVFAEGIDVSVKLRDRTDPILGKIVAIDIYDFTLYTLVLERAETKGIEFSQVEEIERQDKEYELRYAAKVVRDELLQHGDWYNALVKSITGYLIEMQGNAKICDIAEGLAKRLIGDEEYGTD